MGRIPKQTAPPGRGAIGHDETPNTREHRRDFASSRRPEGQVRNRPIRWSLDWRRGTGDGMLWIIDVVAPFGGRKEAI